MPSTLRPKWSNTVKLEKSIYHQRRMSWSTIFFNVPTGEKLALKVKAGLICILWKVQINRHNALDFMTGFLVGLLFPVAAVSWNSPDWFCRSWYENGAIQERFF